MLYKYKSFTDEYKDNIITNSALHFSKVENFNDPLDSRLTYIQNYTEEEIKEYWLANPQYYKTIKEVLDEFGTNEKFIKKQKEINNNYVSKIGVLSLSANPKNILMWSHYSDNHKGLVYEFEPRMFHDKKHNSFTGFPHEIAYVDKYDLLSYIILDDKKKEEQYTKELLTKHTGWKYEEEYRFIDLCNNGEKQFDKNSLKSIIFGAKAQKNDMNYMIELCSENGFNHVQFKKAKIMDGRFEIVIEDLDI